MLLGLAPNAANGPASLPQGECFVQAESGAGIALLDRAPANGDGWTFTPVTPLFQGGRVGPTAGEWLFAVGLWVPTEQCDDFLAWYRTEHLPILLECATWDGCRFVEAPAASGRQFHALHQLADPGALASPERARSRATPWFERLARFDWFDRPFTRTLYRRVSAA